MLIKFTVGNFLTFYKPQQFTMIKGNDNKREKDLVYLNNFNILKLSVIFQRNPVLLKAFDFFKKTVLNQKTEIEIPKNNQPSYFDLKFYYKESFYQYGFLIDLKTNNITRRWLKNLNKPKEIISINIVKAWLSKVTIDLECNEIKKLIINLRNANKGSLLVLDSTDCCLSPKQTINFINYIRNKNIQIVFGTLFSPVMNLDILRKDEIWMEEPKRLFSLDILKNHFYKELNIEYENCEYVLMPF